LLPASVKDIYAVGVPGSQISRLKVKPEPAPRKVKTWPDARVFRINAVLTDPDNPSNKGKPFEAYLVPFADAGGTGSSYKVWLPYEALPADRNLLSDGIEIRSRKPNMGSILDGNLKTVAVTFNKKRAKQDWFGVELQEPAVISRVIFAHGKTFHDGGWFDTSAGKPEVQVQLAPQGTWTNAATLAKYPGTTARNPGGLKDGECFVCALDKPTEVYGVRVIGKPACGDNPAQAFASCAELQAYR
ncbi:MAG TPA: hypothetical protein VHH88_02455, partial [Verrucomicrobiae bacterium]|nr:hypothetical protein [Verrucomicrobiae bacterium]